MHDMDDATRREILGEALMDELKVIREYLEGIIPLVGLIPDMRKDIDELKHDMKLVKMTIREHSQWIRTHEQLHTRLNLM